MLPKDQIADNMPYLLPISEKLSAYIFKTIGWIDPIEREGKRNKNRETIRTTQRMSRFIKIKERAVFSSKGMIKIKIEDNIKADARNLLFLYLSMIIPPR